MNGYLRDDSWVVEARHAIDRHKAERAYRRRLLAIFITTFAVTTPGFYWLLTAINQ